MKIDFKKIINIKNKKGLSNFKLDKPIFINNYLFHYLIIFKNLKGLKLYNFPIYIENNVHLNGFHLAAKEYDFNILCYLIEKYPDYIYNKNKYNHTFLDYLPVEKINKFILKYPNIDWKYLIDPEYSDLIFTILENLNYKELKKFILLFNYKPTNICPYMFTIVMSKKLTIKEKILLLDEISDEDLNLKYLNYSGILIYITNDNLYDNEELIIYLINRNIDFDYFNFKNDNPLRKIIKYDILNNKNELSLLLLNKLKNENILDVLDTFMDNLLHIIFYIRINNKNINFTNYKIDEYLIQLANNYNLNQTNTYFETPLDLISLLDYDIYSKLLLNIKIKKKSLDLIKKYEWTKIFNCSPNEKWHKLFSTFPNYEDNSNNDISLLNYNHMNYSIYRNAFWDMCIHMIYLKNKYDFLYIPIIKNYKLNNLLINKKMNEWLAYSHHFNKFIYPWLILIKSSTEYFIHPYLNNLINSVKYNKKYKYSFIDVYIVNSDLTAHANCIIYDFEKLTIERFEPYGNVNNYYIDDILEEQLTWNTGFKYINPTLFSPLISFQSISQEFNFLNKKFGDPGGYCYAWCLWYLETKMINPKIDSKILISKLIKKINNLEIKFIDYIRNYANELNNEKIAFLKKINFDENKIYDMYFTDNDINYILSHTDKYFDS